MMYFSDHANRWVDALVFLFAGVSAVAFLQGFALIVTIGAGLASISLAALRWHDRIKYGRNND